MAYEKRRERPTPGSIPDLLDMFEREVRFYREIAPDAGVRVPELLSSSVGEDEIVIELEDLSSWSAGGDPIAIAGVLKELHVRWRGIADQRWPWLNRGGRAAAEIGELYDRVWSALRERDDVPQRVRRLGDSLRGRVAELERMESSRAPRTLIHGDAASRNIRTSASGAIALLDWEDVRTAAGEVDLTWMLLSSVPPSEWGEVIAAYEPDAGALLAAVPANAAQAVFGLSESPVGSEAALGWIERLDAAAVLVGE